MAVDRLCHLLAAHVTPATADDRAEIGRLTQAVQTARGERVDLAYVDQGCTGGRAAEAAHVHGIALEVVRLPDATRGFVLLPHRWVAERSFAWATHLPRLVHDYKRFPQTLADLHAVTLVCIMLNQVAQLTANPYQPLVSAFSRRWKVLD